MLLAVSPFHSDFHHSCLQSQDSGSTDRPTTLSKSPGVGRGVPWAPPLLAAVLSAGITQGPVQRRPRELWRQDIADFAGTVLFAPITLEGHQRLRD